MARRPVRRRRLSVALLAVAGAGVVSGCSTFENSNSAAQVDGVDISQDDLDAFLAELLAQASAEPGSQAPTDGTVSIEGSWFALERLIAAEASAQYLEANGESITDEERAAVNVEDYAGLPEDLRTRLTDLTAGEAARGRVAAEGAQAAYEASPYESGALCLRVISVESEDARDQVVEALEAGEPFADVATELSTDPTAANGGELTDENGGPCLASSDISVETGGPIVEAAIALQPGEYSEPIAQDSGTGEGQIYLFLYSRPYDEVADAVATRRGGPAFDDYLATLDVSVDPRYGRWDPETATIVPLV